MKVKYKVKNIRIPQRKKGKVLLDQQQQYPVAHLSSEQLTKIKTMEEELRSSTGEEIVLIAYKNDDE